MSKSSTPNARIDITTLSKLANLTVSSVQSQKLQRQFVQTLRVVDQLDELDTLSIQATPQVTNQKNIFREDRLNPDTSLSQSQALANAVKTHNGYFVVPRVGKSE